MDESHRISQSRATFGGVAIMQCKLAWTIKLESRDWGVVADLLQIDFRSIRELCLESFTKNWVERLPPRLKDMLKPSYKPAVPANSGKAHGSAVVLTGQCKHHGIRCSQLLD